jgi:GT2 family glycosyltransferase
MKVLIGITTHNRADILAKSIQSALNQNYAEKEVAVFDDASSDDTSLLREKFPTVSWYQSQTNQGYLAARNKLMSETDADFYFSLDDDAWFVEEDEISVGVELMKRRTEVAALAYDILSPDRTEPVERLQPFRAHTFIGCGHLLRLSAVREVGYYTPNPGFYGGEEKDLCLQLLDRHYEVMFLPGVHVWHHKSAQARDLEAQHRSGVCNDFVFALRRCPLPMALWLIPGKVVSHLRFAITKDLLLPCLRGMAMFCASLPQVAPTRKPVRATTFHEFLRRSRAGA